MISALLAIGAGVAWHHSRTYQDKIEFVRHVGSEPSLRVIRYRLWSADGTMYLMRHRETFAMMLSPAGLASEREPRGLKFTSMPSIISSFAPRPPQNYPLRNLYNRLGFAFHLGHRASSRSIVDLWEFIAPWWFFVTLFLIVPLARVIAIVRHRLKRDPNCCVVCGYDLRATPDRCPECGTAPKLKPAT